MLTPLSFTHDNAWNTTEPILWLLTPAELGDIPDGTTLHSITGREVVVGVDAIDTDTRFGYLAFGLHEAQFTNEEGE